jgi:medium-chain acyl-[acyl-carrier-protein] hydrolase
MISMNNSWVSIPQPNSKAKIRLFCFPYAGGGATAFYAWRKQLPIEIELCLVHLPGRETRLKEPLFTDLAQLVTASASELLPYLDRPFAFFGHSMGALVAFEMSRHLGLREHTLPDHLFISGHRAPHLPDYFPSLRNLSDNEFIKRLRHLGGTPEAVFKDRELLDIFMPILRADFAILETYQHDSGPPLACPITAFGGLCDPRANCIEIEAWREHTTKGFRSYFFTGGHFFLSQHQSALLQYIASSINSGELSTNL